MKKILIAEDRPSSRELRAELRRDERVADVPMVALAAGAMQGDREKLRSSRLANA